MERKYGRYAQVKQRAEEDNINMRFEEAKAEEERERQESIKREERI